MWCTAAKRSSCETHKRQIKTRALPNLPVQLHAQKWRELHQTVYTQQCFRPTAKNTSANVAMTASRMQGHVQDSWQDSWHALVSAKLTALSTVTTMLCHLQHDQQCQSLLSSPPAAHKSTCSNTTRPQRPAAASPY